MAGRATAVRAASKRGTIVRGVAAAALVVVALGITGAAAGATGAPPQPKLEILDKDPTIHFREDSGPVEVVLTVKVSDAPLPYDELHAQLLLDAGGTVPGTLVPGTPPRKALTKGSVTQLTMTFPSEDLTGAGGTISLVRAAPLAKPSADRTSLATVHVAFARQVSMDEGFLIVLVPLGLAILTVIVGAALVYHDLPRPDLDEHKDRRAHIEQNLPKRAKWTFSEGWAGNMTAFGAAVTSVLAATGIFTEFLPGVAAAPFIAANIFFVALVATAPMIYSMLATEQRKDDEVTEIGTMRGLYAGGVASLYGVYGFIGLLIALVGRLEEAGPRYFYWAVLALGGAGVSVYAVATMRKVAKPTGAAPAPAAPTAAVDVPVEQVAQAIDAARTGEETEEVVRLHDALQAAAQQVPTATVAVPVPVMPVALAARPDDDTWAMF